MTLTLAIDTSTEVRAGLAQDGEPLAFEVILDARAHAEQLMPLVLEMTNTHGVQLADISRIAVGVGPGPFTGLRVGVVTALTLGQMLGVPVRGVCSLDVIARQWADADAPQEFSVVADARRREVYWARYTRDGVRVDGPHVGPPDNIPPLPLAGPGAHLAAEASGPTGLDAGVMAATGWELPDMGHEPLYLRRPDAEVPTRIKSTLVTPRRPRRRNR